MCARPRHAKRGVDATRILDATRVTDATHVADATRLVDVVGNADATRITGIANVAPPTDDAHVADATRVTDATRVSVPRITAPLPANPMTDVRRAPVVRESATPAKPAAAVPPPRPRPAAIADASEFRRMFALLRDAVSRAIIGKRRPIELCLTALVAGGHILLEDEPGTGKTQLARAIAGAVDASFGRVQCTPDLLPSDVTGMTVYHRHRDAFAFRPGPVFASIVLADELNRASPKTQSALLEVMEERTVTADGVSHAVPTPFMVIATQNPAGQSGTYPLPEAQLDRFLIRTALGHPGHAAALEILRQADVRDRAAEVRPVLGCDDVLRMRAFAERVHVDDRVAEYALRIAEATRHDDRVAAGASMRGALSLVRCSRVAAAAQGRDYAVPDDVADLAVPVLAHRLRLDERTLFAHRTAADVTAELLDGVPSPDPRIPATSGGPRPGNGREAP